MIKLVCEGKLKEIRLGIDGFIVHDLALVPVLNKVSFKNRNLYQNW